MKRLITILALMLTIIPFSAWGSYDFIVDGIYYEINPDLETVSVYGDYLYNKYSGDIVIPESVSYNGDSYRVVAIGPGAFKNNYDLTSISLPNSIIEIKKDAFSGCVKLTSISFPSSVKIIGCGVFSASGIISLFIPKTVEVIEDHAFSYCKNITTLNIEEDSKVVIGEYAFAQTPQLSSISFPNTIIDMGENVFYESAWYESQYDGPVYIGSVFYEYKGIRNSSIVSIKEGTTSIADGAFSHKEIDQVTLPSTLKVIGDCAFYHSELPVISLPPNLVKIGDWAFAYCNISSIIFPESLESIGEAAFKGNTKLESISLPQKITVIPKNAFSECTSLSYISYSDNVTAIEKEAFLNCSSLATIPVSSKLINLSADSFSGTKWYDNQPDGIIYFGNILMGYKGTMPELFDLIIKEGTTAIASCAFMNCNIGSVSIPNSVKEIGSGAFQIAKGLKSVVLPSSLTSIHSNTFFYCKSLESVVIPDNVTKIEERAFSSCSKLSSITLPPTLSEIGKFAFSSCSSLRSIKLPDSVSFIDYAAFASCNSLKEVIIPDNVRYIECSAFDECKRLTDLTLGKSVRKICEFAFSCPWIYRVVSLNPKPPICHKDAFSRLNIEASRLNVPKESIDLYSQAPIWREFPLIVELGVGAVDNLPEDKFSITGQQGEIHINGADGEQVEIYSTSGILQYRAISEGNDVISLPAGIYIVKVNGKTSKLAI